MHDGIKQLENIYNGLSLSHKQEKRTDTPAIAWEDPKSFMLGKKADPKGHRVVFSRL